MNILFTISSLAKEAPVRLLFDIAKGLKHKKHKILLVTLNREKLNSMQDEFIAGGIQIISMNASKFDCEIHAHKIRKRIKKLIVENDIDLLHCSCYNSTVVCSKIKEIKKSLTFHNYCAEDYIFSKGHILGQYMSFRFLRAASLFDIPIAISQAMQSFYKAKLADADVRYIYNGIDTEKFINVTTKNEKQEKKKELNLPLEKKIYLVCGSLCKRKNPLAIIRAFIDSNLSNAVLVFIGDGLLLEKAKCYANENVIFHGFVTNTKDYLMASDVLISASYSEGLPLNSIEALSAGLSLILSDIRAHEEIAKLYESEHIKLFPIKEESVLSQEISNLHKVSYFEHSNEIRSKTIELFSKEIMINKYEQLFKSVKNHDNVINSDM